MTESWRDHITPELFLTPIEKESLIRLVIGLAITGSTLAVFLALRTAELQKPAQTLQQKPSEGLGYMNPANPISPLNPINMSPGY